MMKMGSCASIFVAVEFTSLSLSCLLHVPRCASGWYTCIYSGIVLLSGPFHHHMMAVFNFIYSSDLKPILFDGNHLFLLCFNFQWCVLPFSFIVFLMRCIYLLRLHNNESSISTLSFTSYH